ncbi:hypothetical protein AB0D08_30820 [Kitasatospora sp. NPDC048540]|uniref:hypothetical protein n=1 Tax=unclassified Kitasatospora TaxID=2633591 RepID=UPI00068D6B56|nr:hypothetical protein [Kitasatospora sp. MBT63]
MDGLGGTGGSGAGGGPELCDRCGAVVPLPELVVLRVPDSSAVAGDMRFDGERLLRACGEAHLVELAALYQHRPFVTEELWSGQIVRAVRLLGKLDDEEMYERVVAMTGLSEEKLRRAAAWQERHGRPSGPAGP